MGRPGSIYGGSLYGRSVAGSVYGDRSMAWSDASIGSIGHMLHAADLQHRRSIKMLHNVTRLAELEADRQLAQAEKAAARESHLAAFEAAKEEERRKAAEEAAVLEEHRRARAEAAARDEAAVRQAALRKVMALEERADEFEKEKAAVAQQNAEHAKQMEAKRQAAYQAALAAEEAKRASFKARQDAADRILREKEELKQLEKTIKDEQAFLRQEARAAAKERAEAELAQRTAIYRRKGQSKEANLESWQKQATHVRRLKNQESKARAEYITMQARSAAEADAARRAQYRAIATSKAVRVDAIVAEREALAEQLQRIRYSMVRQEQAVRCSLDELRRKGAPFRAPSINDTGSIADGYAASVARSQALTTRSRMAQSVIGSVHGGGRAASVRSRPVSAVSRKPTGVAGSAAAAEYKRVRPMSASAVLRAGAAAAAVAGMPTEAPDVPGFTQAGYSTMGAVQLNAAGKREEELRHVLREEIDKETERQAILAGTSDAKDAHRLALIFAAEREDAKRRILDLSAAAHAAANTTTTLTPRPAAPGATGAPATHTFLTPASTGPSTPPATAEVRVPFTPAQGASVVAGHGFRTVYTEPAVAVPTFSVPAAQMLQPVQPHHHAMMSVGRRVPVV